MCPHACWCHGWGSYKAREIKRKKKMLVEAPEGEIIEADNRKFWKKKAWYINFPFRSGAQHPPPPDPNPLQIGIHSRLSLLNVRKCNIESCSCICSLTNKTSIQTKKKPNKFRWSFPPPNSKKKKCISQCLLGRPIILKTGFQGKSHSLVEPLHDKFCSTVD